MDRMIKKRQDFGVFFGGCECNLRLRLECQSLRLVGHILYLKLLIWLKTRQCQNIV